MTEERKETMEQETTMQQPKENPLHNLNVFGWYLTSAVDVAIGVWVALEFFGLSLSLKVYVLGTIAGAILYYVCTSKEEIQNTVGLFIRYQDLKAWNKHVILDIILSLSFGYLGECVSLYIIVFYFIEVFYVISPDTLQVLMFICVILNTAKSISDRYRESLEEQ